MAHITFTLYGRRGEPGEEWSVLADVTTMGTDCWLTGGHRCRSVDVVGTVQPAVDGTVVTIVGTDKVVETAVDIGQVVCVGWLRTAASDNAGCEGANENGIPCTHSVSLPH